MNHTIHSLAMEQNTSTYIFLSSKDSLTFFPDNSPGNFRVKLDSPLMLNRYWYVALCEFFL